MSKALLLVLILAYFIAIQKDNRNTIGATAALVPFNQYLPGLGVPLLNLHTLLIVGMVWGLMRAPSPSRNVLPVSPTFLLPAFAFMLLFGYIVTLMQSVPMEYEHLYEPWEILVGTLKDKGAVLFLCWGSFRLAGDPVAARRGLYGIFAAVTLEVLFCFGEFILQPGQVTGHLGLRAPMATFLATYAVMAVGFFLSKQRFRGRWWVLALGVIGCLVATGTFSRGAVLAIGVCLLFLSLWRSRILFVILLLLVFNYQAWLPDHLQQRFDTAYEETDDGELELASTAADRVEIWKAGMRTIPDYPAGLGLGMYPLISPRYGTAEILNRPNKSAHNEIVLYIVELGVLGGTIWLLLLFSMVRSGWQVYRSDPDSMFRAMGFAAIVGILGAVSANMVVSLMLASVVSGMLWILLGLTARRAAEIRAGNLAGEGDDKDRETG